MQAASLPFVLAVVLTALNAAKPVVVDDTAYLLFARHIAAHPSDPYGFEVFWYAHPEPAMHVLVPPVLPYWLAWGIALFGENLVALKLALFPFAATYCYAVRSLLNRLARGQERSGLVLLTLSPFVLPLFNFMLDLPALAIGLAAVALFVQGCDRGRLGIVVLAGVLAGVAAQTKYTMLTVPMVMAWYGILHRRMAWAGVAAVTAALVFSAWEVWVEVNYGVSHFLFHVRDRQADSPRPIVAQIFSWVDAKSYLITPLIGHLGGLASVWALVEARSLGFGRRTTTALWVVAVVGLIAVAVVPSEDSVLLRNSRTGSVRLDLASLVFLTLGWAVLSATAVGASALTMRVSAAPTRFTVRRHPASWFLVGWLAIEIGAYFVLTPFPAARRVMAICIVIGLIACRRLGQVIRAHPHRRLGRGVLTFGVGCGIGLMLADVWDAIPEHALAREASRTIGHRGSGTAWFQGHWGWQYYCEREGMKLVDPGRSLLRADDWLIVPVLPDTSGFYRPYHGGAEFALDPEALALLATWTWDDPIACETVPALYGGPVPFRGRNHPRLRVAVYRVNRDWAPMPAHRP